MEQTSFPAVSSATISDDLDRIEVLVGKIGMNKPEQALSILYGLDSVYPRLQALGNESSRKIAEGQMESVTARLRSEAGTFLRDVGGIQRYDAARQQALPPAEHWWWYLDGMLAEKRNKSLRRTLIVSGVILAALVILGVLYQAFLAPDPEVAARYTAEQSARDSLATGDLDDALREVEQGLTVAPNDPSLLIIKGVILETQGQQAQAEQIFEQAKKGAKEDEFYLLRGQSYLFASQLDKALADGQQAAALNPNSPQAYLISGQAYEMKTQYTEAMAEYDKAFAAAESGDQPEMAAIARMRTAMLVQALNSKMPDLNAATPSPTP